MRFWFLLLRPSFFWSLWAGNQVTGVTGDEGYGGPGLPGYRDAVGLYNSPDGVADSAPGALPLDPRQGDAPLEPPSPLARPSLPPYIP